MPFLKDYVYYSSGTEVPEAYTWWAGLSLLGHLLGNKVSIVHGDYFRFHPNLYVCLVGNAGSGKNTGLSVNIEIMLKYFPELMMSASIQSREDVAKLMASDECARVWQDKAGETNDYRPFYILNNELASFLSVDRIKMTEFLVEVYDGKHFSTGFKKDREPGNKQWFRNPHVSLIAGAVPTWFMSNLKLDLFSGGLGRRMIIVYSNRTKVVPIPTKPPGHEAAMSRVIEHLQKAYYFNGTLRLATDATKWWVEWYTKNRNNPPEDPILSQFHETKHMQVLKLATLLRLAESFDDLSVGADHLEGAVALLEDLEPSIVKLTSGVGRNELAGVGAEIMSLLDAAGGWMTEKKLQATCYRLVPNGLRGLTELLQHLQKTEQIVAAAPPDGPMVGRIIIFTKARFEQYEKEKKL